MILLGCRGFAACHQASSNMVLQLLSPGHLVWKNPWLATLPKSLEFGMPPVQNQLAVADPPCTHTCSSIGTVPCASLPDSCVPLAPSRPLSVAVPAGVNSNYTVPLPVVTWCHCIVTPADLAKTMLLPWSTVAVELHCAPTGCCFGL